MAFIHDDPDFEDLLRIVADRKGLGPALVEKDYWVAHSLWALQDMGFDLWFKGGTSLSKGFGIIERFSEDLDLRIDPGAVAGAPEVSNWTKDTRTHLASRLAYFEFLGRKIVVPGARIARVTERTDTKARSADYQVLYPGRFLLGLEPPFSPFVRLEVGRARVDPFVKAEITSFVHDHLAESGLLSNYDDNRALRLRCVHPLVTLIDKLDAIARFHRRKSPDAPRYVRHYGDAARIIAALDRLPSAGVTANELVDAMVQARDIRARPAADDPAFTLPDDARRKSLLDAHRAIAPMFWGARQGLMEEAATIVGWLSRL